MRIVAEHLSYTYNADTLFATAALKDVSLTVEEGEFFGIIGHTGSGKSTFVQHLNGLIRVPSSMKRYKKKKPKKGQP
ncbi:MAG: ATP-binding cassette domain-containing protein, partial [Clostridia bacterium]|nr:ATP-binding cassette domain-containing protein [Clostridia bacterium]